MFKLRLNLVLILGIFFLFSFLISCERIEKSPQDNEMISENKTISTEEIQRILKTKVNLESVLVSDEVKLSVPENYYFATSEIKAEDYDDHQKFGKIDLASKKSYDYVELVNSLFYERNLCEELVLIIKEEDQNILTIEDLKEDLEIETIYFEDKNSIVYSESKTFSTLHFQYDLKSKSYLIYTGSISWAKEFPLDEKLDLAFYFLRNAKNLLNENTTKQDFSWEDYAENNPKIEINLLKNFFGSMEKEMKVFLDENKSAYPRYEDYSFVELYRLNPAKEGEFYNYLNSLKSGKYVSEDSENWFEKLFYSTLNLNSINKYDIISKGNSSIIEISTLDSDGKLYKKQYSVVCFINYKGKTFVLKNTRILNDKEVDLYVKMFNYFSSNYSLNTSPKK